MTKFIKFLVFPVLFYFIFFFILTYPAILSFSRVLFADTGDGLQNVWNLWWVNRAVTVLHQSIWHTNLLHYPIGTTLIGHSLTPINGLLGILLLKLFPLIQVYNVIFIFIFVASGLTAFFLAFYLTRNYPGSLLSGYIYTFSEFHFAHAEGHLQTMSIEWIPLFILVWLLFLEKPSLIFILGSVVTLYLNILSDFYAFFYCVLAAVIIYLFKAYKSKNFFLVNKKKFILSGITFLLFSALSWGKIVISLILQNQKDPLVGAHPAVLFSTDLLSIILPGGHSRFADLTYSFWSKLPGNIHENSVFLGFSVLGMIAYLWSRRKKIRDRIIYAWFIILAFFIIMSFGPQLQINSRIIPFPFMPYSFLEKVIPFLTLSGVPLRMMAVATLAAGILFAYSFDLVSRMKGRNKVILIFITILLFIEYLPKPVTVTSLDVPPYIKNLSEQKGDGGVLDTVSPQSMALYYQTIHGKPLAFGYLARIPQSVVLDDMAVAFLLREKNFTELCQTYGFKYLIADKTFPKADNAKIIYDDNKVKLLELGGDTPCQPQ